MKRVAVAIIKSHDEFGRDQYLLIQSFQNFGEFTGYWYPPGGHLEEGETDEQALKRELKEELNLEIEPVRMIAETDGDIPDQITAWWECSADIKSDRFDLQEEEISDAEFFTHDQMTAIQIWPATKKFFENYIFKKKIE